MFHLFQLYVVNVLSLYFKSRLSVAHVAMRASGWRIAACRRRLVLLRGRRAWFTCRRGMGAIGLVLLRGHSHG
jgi:hypothetical protein